METNINSIHTKEKCKSKKVLVVQMFIVSVHTYTQTDSSWTTLTSISFRVAFTLVWLIHFMRVETEEYAAKIILCNAFNLEKILILRGQ